MAQRPNPPAPQRRSAGRLFVDTLDTAGHAVRRVVDTLDDASHTVAHAADDAGHAMTKGTARTREEVEDIYADARQVADTDTGRDAAVFAGLAATAAVGVLDLPIAAALGAGYALFRRR